MAVHSMSDRFDLGPMPTGARMRTLDKQLVRAPVARIFELAANVEEWPKHLAHYRSVRFRERSGRGGVVEMAADRPFGLFDWPTWWVSLMQVIEGDAPRIRFRHIEGVTTRMDVEWRFQSAGDCTLVEIEHLWQGPSWPLIGPIAATGVIGPVFVHGIASRTLAGLAFVSEQSLTSGPV
jgi:ribosome-associated toxin RatA of RatAB toxin-antitoxin module